MGTVKSGLEFKNEMRAGNLKLGLFLNSHSPTVAEQLARSGYDWLLVDTQHGPMGNESVNAAKKNNVVLGLFLFGTARVGEFVDKGFTFISIGNDLHHVLTQAGAYVVDVERIAKEKGKSWTRRPTALF